MPRPLLLLALSCMQMSALSALVTEFTCSDKTLKKAFELSSETVKLGGTPTQSVLKRRAQHDVEKFEDLAHYYGYYSANIRYQIQNSDRIVFIADLGPKYALKAFSSNAPVKAEELGLKIGDAITTKKVLDAEEKLLWLLKKEGYGLAFIQKREVIAHTTDHTISLRFDVDIGPKLSFGPTTIVGAGSVRHETINKYILYKEGSPYSPIDIARTQESLEKTGLFSSVVITESRQDVANNNLPITINVQESKHRAVGVGFAYATPWGPGVKAEWENKNLRGSGDKLTFRTELWQKYQTVIFSLTKPHFRGHDQDLIWVAEYDKLRNLAFKSRSYNASGIVQKRLSNTTEFLAGVRVEWLHSHNYEGSHLYHLLKMPMQYKWSNANNLLDPTKGETYNLKLTPTTNFLTPSFFYTIHTSTLSAYRSIFNNRLTLAAKVVFGNILGAARNTIPPPDRFYGGSENVLRGFRAYTVSPLHHRRIPEGGRSLLAASFEARFRTAGDFGYVLFYDVGNVYKKNVPELQLRQYHSVGAGLRYNTPIGPLRFDVAVPINPRPHIDPSFQIYFSIGQSF